MLWDRFKFQLATSEETSEILTIMMLRPGMLELTARSRNKSYMLVFLMVMEPIKSHNYFEVDCTRSLRTHYLHKFLLLSKHIELLVVI